MDEYTELGIDLRKGLRVRIPVKRGEVRILTNADGSIEVAFRSGGASVWEQRIEEAIPDWSGPLSALAAAKNLRGK